VSVVDDFKTVRQERPGIEDSDLQIFAPAPRDEPVRLVRSMTHPTAPWVDQVLHQARALVSIRPNWNGHGAPAIDPQVVLAALEELSTFMPADAVSPVVGPTACGGVQFEWHAGGWDVEVEVVSDGHTEAWGEHRSSGECWEGTLPGVREQLIVSLKRLSLEAH
jgi:hypothetical protein